MNPKESRQGILYRIKVKEALSGSIANWFDDLTVTSLENGETLLVVPIADQVALRGLLDHLWNLNITVISVERIENEN